MKNSKQIFIACCIISSNFSNLFAQKARIFGAQITYTKTNVNTFDVRYTLLLSHEDTAFTPAGISCYVNSPAAPGGRIQLSTPVLVSTTKQLSSLYCMDVKKYLNQYQFSSVIDLNDPKFSAIKNDCELRFEMQACCRDSMINVFTGENIFIYSEFNNCSPLINKSTVTFFADLEATACLNQPFYYQMGASDTSEYDSLSYTFETPMTNITGDTVVYQNGFKKDLPLSVYYQSPLKYPYVNVNANPPMGLFLDPEAGDLIFTPVTFPQTSSFVIKITEWRKNSSGIYQKIGSTTQEKRINIISCSDNYPPQITNTDFTYRTCAGERICFNATTDDKVFIPPAPLPIPPPDTVRLSWNRGIPGATFTIINKGQLNETGRFCWTPEKNDAKDVPYVIIVSAKDEFCPINAITLRSFRVFVKHKAIADRRFTRLSDGRVLVEALWTTGRGTPSGSYWKVLDQTGTIISDNSLARFSSSDSFWSAQMVDTLYLKNSGTYHFSFLINNLPNNCPETYDDTYVYNTLGVDNLKKTNQIILYPNPCTQNLAIDASEFNLSFYQVIDVSGRLLFEGKFESPEQLLDVSGLQPGIYNLVLGDGTSKYQKRFLKISEF